MNVPGEVARLRRPEYTGENRCVPCTVLNVLVAGVLAAIIGLVSHPGFGLVAFSVSALVIYLRGYLVPGTPTLTRRYFPPWVLRLFGKDPLEGRRAVDEPARTTADGDVETESLFTAGVLAETDADGVELTATFRETWSERMATVHERGVEVNDVRVMFDADTVTRHGDRSFVVDGNASIRWDSVAALVADVAATEILRECVDWSAFDRDRRRSVLLSLRLFLRNCPACDGALSVTEERVDPCCQKPHLVAESVCRDCGAVVADAAAVDREGVASVRTNLLG
ncbi:Rab5-interacting family protein [Halomarina pelagica]|uniref:Rab5-interacting family protein n=1 Tax=Halomarina pelagica TaxID=2961599 RepID=UPI0020C1BC43|nr:Rab5-interacting family protein [Halomarina sp. BND7]